MQPLVLILIALLAAAVLVPLARARATRRRALASLALRHGWTYTPGDPWDLPAEMEGFWLGTWGHDRCCRNVISVPTQTGALWLAQFDRQMSSGRHRCSQRFALALVRVSATSGGIAILPQEEWFAPTRLFQRYRRVGDLKASTTRQIWAERPDSQQRAIASLAKLCAEASPPIAIESRGNTAVIYWPIPRTADEQTLTTLESLGRRLIEILGEPAGHRPAAVPVS